jgi:hypothetical protein
MRRLSLLAFIASISTIACNKPSAADVQNVPQYLHAIAGLPDDAELRSRMLFQACSELKSCAEGCDRAFKANADPNSDPAQHATLLAACSSDYKKRRDHGEKLTAAAWLEQHWKGYLDRVRELVPEGERAAFDADRAKAKL